MKKIEIGTKVRLTYKGKTQGKRGKPYDNFDVEFDNEDTITV